MTTSGKGCAEVIDYGGAELGSVTLQASFKAPVFARSVLSFSALSLPSNQSSALLQHSAATFSLHF